MIIPPAENVVWELDPNLAVTDVREIDNFIASSVASPRFRTLLLSLLAVLALVLSLIGIYGVLAYTVAQRKSEIGIRMALGASHRDVVANVARGGLAMTLAGLGLGVVVAFFAVRILDAFLFEVQALDPIMFFGTAGMLAATSALASFVPVRRATRVDPAVSLRDD